MNALTPAEILELLRVASRQSRHNVRDTAMLCLGFKHGMRASEITGLKLSDLDLRNEQVTVRRLKGSKLTTQSLTDLPGQPLLSELKLLKSWLGLRRDASDYVFTSDRGGRLSRVQLFRIFQRLSTEAGLQGSKRHPHCLKHSLGYALVAQGVHLAHVKQALGHQNIASTMHYVQPTPEQTATEVGRALANAF